MNPKQALERAAYNYLTNLETALTGIASTSIYKGIENAQDVESEESAGEASQKVHPSVTLEAEGNHEEAVLFTGNWQGILAITVEASASGNTDTTFNTICDEVFSKFNFVELEVNFSSRTASFHMYQMHSPVFSDTINNGQNWQKTLRLTCVYALADL